MFANGMVIDAGRRSLQQRVRPEAPGAASERPGRDALMLSSIAVVLDSRWGRCCSEFRRSTPDAP
jgi:hypothetical protein